MRKPRWFFFYSYAGNKWKGIHDRASKRGSDAGRGGRSAGGRRTHKENHGKWKKNTKKRSVYHGQLNCLMEFQRRYCYSAELEYTYVYTRSYINAQRVHVCVCVRQSVIFRGISMLSVSPFHQIGIRVTPSVVLYFFRRIRWQIKIGYYRIK